ncbi:major facilitator superfamily protein [Striga asiatica]|uniref:Major facilitator superfamily protein n=1 Tax=Striga asiatica TaxID=4170 RepID=A0A5A7QRR3_STRAF|nr:major facilitator superfamily protein [Striga asiatica]
MVDELRVGSAGELDEVEGVDGEGAFFAGVGGFEEDAGRQGVVGAVAADEEAELGGRGSVLDVAFLVAGVHARVVVHRFDRQVGAGSLEEDGHREHRESLTIKRLHEKMLPFILLFRAIASLTGTLQTYAVTKIAANFIAKQIISTSHTTAINFRSYSSTKFTFIPQYVTSSGANSPEINVSSLSSSVAPNGGPSGTARPNKNGPYW